jgi:DNA-binding beta-propeller fold protein YncE
MAVSVNRAEVYVAVFESGNSTTILSGGSTMSGGFPPNAVSDPAGPYDGVNPPPNDGLAFRPPMNAANSTPPPVGLIVRKDPADRWRDDNGGDWTDMVSGPLASHSGRREGWDLLDHDLAVIDAQTLGIRYVSGLMNICMAVEVNPASGELLVVGTDATNEVRFEPVLAGRFLRVNSARVNPIAGAALAINDLNPHLAYTGAIPFVPIAQAERDKSIGDPRAIAWNSAGTRGYVAGMGSNNVIVVNSTGGRANATPSIAVGEGPTGLALDQARARLYVLNKFSATISVVDLLTETQLTAVPLFDPTPVAIKTGRRHLYDTHRNSGLGHVSCASCHVDGRIDRLAWDLGDPAGAVKLFNQNCGAGLVGGCEDWHPMKGPMTTQTLQDIIGKEPHHWRGDRDGIEQFADAFRALLGDDAGLSPAAMQEFENFLATITVPPNPYRNFNNTLPDNLSLAGHFATGEFALPAGAPLPNGNAITGLNRYRTGLLDGVNCVTCHTLPSGVGTNRLFQGFSSQPFPPGPNGELHHALVAQDGSTNVSMKVPQLRNLYEKTGSDLTQLENTAGFGFLHDGSVDSIARFLNEPVFSLVSDQDSADLVAFMLSFSGSGLPAGSVTNPGEPLGPTSKDTPAAVGWQATLIDEATAPPAQLTLISSMIAQAQTGAVGLIVKGVQGGEQRGYVYDSGSGTFRSDRAAETRTPAALRALAHVGTELTYTVVPAVARVRLGIDRDGDSFLDADEQDACSNPAASASTPLAPGNTPADADRDGDVDGSDYFVMALCIGGPGQPVSRQCACVFDADHDNDLDLQDYGRLQIVFSNP